MTPLFLQVGMGFSPFHAGLMMIPMIIGSMGMKRIVVQVVNRFGYRNVLVAATLMLALVTLSFPLVAMLGWVYLLPVVLFFQGMVNALRFRHEYPDAERSARSAGQQRQQPAVDGDAAIHEPGRQHSRDPDWQLRASSGGGR